MSELALQSAHLDVQEEANIRDSVVISGSGFLRNHIVTLNIQGRETVISVELKTDNTGAFSTTGSAIAASGLLTSTGELVTEGDTVTIGDVTYTFKDVIDIENDEWDVAIGEYASDTLTNLKAAINLEDQPEFTQYRSVDGSTLNPLVQAVDASVIDIHLAARVPGSLGNAIPTTTDASELSFGSDTLEGGEDANNQNYLKFNPTHDGVWTIHASDGMNQVSRNLRVWSSS